MSAPRLKLPKFPHYGFLGKESEVSRALQNAASWYPSLQPRGQAYPLQSHRGL